MYIVTRKYYTINNFKVGKIEMIYDDAARVRNVNKKIHNGQIIAKDINWRKLETK